MHPPRSWSPLLLLLRVTTATATILSRTWVKSDSQLDRAGSGVGRPTPLETKLPATLTASPNERTALLSLADRSAQGGRLPEAIARYEQALAAAPTEVTARIALAQALLAHGYVAGTSAQLQVVPSLEPSESHMLFPLGQAAERSTPPDEALALFWYEKAAASGDDAYARLARHRLPELPSP